MTTSAIRFNAVQGSTLDPEATPYSRRAGSRVSVEIEFDTFFRAEFARVVRTVALLLNDRGRAEEVAQDAFVQLLDHWSKVSRYEQPDAWVRRVAIRMASRSASRERRRPFLEHRSQPRESVPAGDDVTGDVHAALRLLPAGQRAVIVLFSSRIVRSRRSHSCSSARPPRCGCRCTKPGND